MSEQLDDPHGSEASTRQTVRGTASTAEAVGTAPSKDQGLVTEPTTLLARIASPSVVQASERIKAILGPFGDLKGLLAVVGAFVYGAFRLSYDGFYGELGVTPEEVGVNSGTVLLRAVFGLIFLLITWAVFLPVLALTASRGIDLDKNPKPLQDFEPYVPELRRFGRRWLKVLAFLWLLVGILGVPFAKLFDDPSLVWLSVINIILGALAWLISLSLLPPAGTEPERSLGTSFRRQRLLISKVLIVAIIVGAWLMGAQSYGQAEARSVENGQTVRPNVLTSLLSLRAEKVCVGWIGSATEKPASLSLDRPFMLLGQANATLVLYRSKSEGVTSGPVRIPGGKAVLLPSGDSTCP